MLISTAKFELNKKNTDYKSIAYFNGLNALRFFAALLVLLHHNAVIRPKYGIGEGFGWLGIFRDGGYAVSFFFVLSGFLITYILLKEKDKTQTISIKRFYLKRILRIWPLYYLLIILGSIIIPFLISYFDIDYQIPYTFHETWYYFIFFLPGLVTFYYGHHILEPLWSIGVEEIFYLLWAPLFKFIKKHILLLILSIIIIKIILSIISFYWDDNSIETYLVNTYKFEAMSIGGIGAYMVFYKGNIILNNIIFKRYFQIPILSIILVFLLFNVNIKLKFWKAIFFTPIVSNYILYLLYVYLIICISLVDKSIIKLRWKGFKFLGDISYGIYMYHMPISFMVIFSFKKYLLRMGMISNFIIYYALVIGGTILISLISKLFFENYFLKLKDSI